MDNNKEESLIQQYMLENPNDFPAICLKDFGEYHKAHFFLLLKRRLHAMNLKLVDLDMQDYKMGVIVTDNIEDYFRLTLYGKNMANTLKRNAAHSIVNMLDNFMTIDAYGHIHPIGILHLAQIELSNKSKATALEKMLIGNKTFKSKIIEQDGKIYFNIYYNTAQDETCRPSKNHAVLVRAIKLAQYDLSCILKGEKLIYLKPNGEELDYLQRDTSIDREFAKKTQLDKERQDKKQQLGEQNILQGVKNSWESGYISYILRDFSYSQAMEISNFFNGTFGLRNEVVTLKNYKDKALNVLWTSREDDYVRMIMLSQYIKDNFAKALGREEIIEKSIQKKIDKITIFDKLNNQVPLGQIPFLALYTKNNALLNNAKMWLSTQENLQVASMENQILTTYPAPIFIDTPPTREIIDKTIQIYEVEQHKIAKKLSKVDYVTPITNFACLSQPLQKNKME